MKFFHLYLIFLIFSSGNAQSTSSALVDIEALSQEFILEMRYGQTTNLMGEVMYDCEKCLLRPEVADALIAANQYFMKKGYRIRLYDCYRPLDIQKKMWEKYPRPTYVANPYGQASIHNRGAAIDLTLETLEGCYVDMGTDFDHFGIAAHIDNWNLPEDVLENRKLLAEGMKKFGFGTIRTEWWHFSYKKNFGYEILNEALPCHKEKE